MPYRVILFFKPIPVITYTLNRYYQWILLALSNHLLLNAKQMQQSTFETTEVTMDGMKRYQVK